ncbi:hypothetical protein GCM10010191_62970 [Actinomadura vinacea]|uniref:DUF4190 domain-containing protein n=1 Tax=Actinomadura vinacea TaxID=115336 RepID=A0ABN3JSD5_9ACTN
MSEAAPAPGSLHQPKIAAPSYGFGVGPDGAYTRTGQVLAFLAGLWTMVLFFPLLFPGALLYARAEEVFEQDPARARTLMLWSWLSITVAPLFGGALLVGVSLLLR